MVFVLILLAVLNLLAALYNFSTGDPANLVIGVLNLAVFFYALFTGFRAIGRDVY